MLKPPQSSCRLYTGCQPGRKQVLPDLIRRLLASLPFDNVFILFDASSAVCLRSSSLLIPDSSLAVFSLSLATTPFERSSMRWCEACPCRPIQEGLSSIFNTAPSTRSSMFVVHASIDSPVIEPQPIRHSYCRHVSDSEAQRPVFSAVPIFLSSVQTKCQRNDHISSNRYYCPINTEDVLCCWGFPRRAIRFDADCRPAATRWGTW